MEWFLQNNCGAFVHNNIVKNCEQTANLILNAGTAHRYIHTFGTSTARHQDIQHCTPIPSTTYPHHVALKATNFIIITDHHHPITLGCPPCPAAVCGSGMTARTLYSQSTRPAAQTSLCMATFTRHPIPSHPTGSCPAALPLAAVWWAK